MTGTWDISLLRPARVAAVPEQSGAIVTGTYVLDGGYSGSVQGTFVNRKVVLEAGSTPGSPLGAARGFLAPDGTRIRARGYVGTRRRDGGEGQWNGVRAAPQP